jgi:hypothetical protein
VGDARREAMKIELSYDEICEAVEQWVERNHPYVVDPEYPGVAWEIEKDQDENDEDADFPSAAIVSVVPAAKKPKK